jgi:hypothetical protein
MQFPDDDLWRKRKKRRRDEEDWEDEDLDEVDEPGPRRKRRKKVTDRAYIHSECGGATQVSGDDFTRLADPFSFVSSTYCCGCSSFVGLSKVRWADTREKISEYRGRLRAETPLGRKLFCWVIGPAVGALIGLAIGAAAGKGQAAGPIAGVVTGALVSFLFIAPPLARLFWQIDYRSEP